MNRDIEQQSVPNESQMELHNESLCESQMESQMESQNESQNESVNESVEMDLGTINGAQITYHEEDNISFISVSKNDAVIDEVQAKLVPASKIRSVIKSGKINELKYFVPSEAFELFKSEFNKAKPKVENQNKQAMIDSINKLRASIKNKAHRKAEYEKQLNGLKGNEALLVRKLHFDIHKDKFSLAKLESELKRL